MNHGPTLLLAVALAATAAPAAAPAPSIGAAVADPARPAEDTARDAERKPAAMLAFAGVKPGMTVVDLLPGGGYFTRLFAGAVGPAGRVYAWVPDEMLARAPQALDKVTAIAAEPGHGSVVPAHTALAAFKLDTAADIVWTSQNYHDFYNPPGADPIGFNRLVFQALKPGGAYVILDHSAPAGSGTARTRDLHRIDPAAVRRDVEAAGFRFEGESRVLANPADTRAVKVTDPAIRGHTDQFVLKFRKPG